MDPKLIDALTSPNGILAFLVLIAPGFVAIRTMELLISGERRKAADAIVDIVLFSVITDAIWGFLLYAAGVRSLMQLSLWWQVALLILIVFVTPAALMSLYIAVRRKWAGRRGGIDPEPKPWDYAFHERFRDPVQIVFTLSGGRKIGGFWQPPSAASGFPAPEQLFVADVFAVDQTSGLLIGKIQHHRGMIIDKASIDVVEFFDFERAYAEDDAGGAAEGAGCKRPECLSTWAILQRTLARKTR